MEKFDDFRIAPRDHEPQGRNAGFSTGARADWKVDVTE